MINFLGSIANQIQFSKFIKEHSDKNIYGVKERTLLGKCLIPLANFILRFRKPKVKMLTGKEWKEWETSCYQTLHQIKLKNSDTKPIIIPQLNGRSLKQIIQNDLYHQTTLLKIIEGSAYSLISLHTQKSSYFSDGFLSHGDATVANILYLDDSNLAWVDFDMRHLANESHEMRHADDILSFLFSLSSAWPNDQVDIAIEKFLNAYSNQNVLENIFHLLEYRFDLLHRAHASMETTRYHLSVKIIKNLVGSKLSNF